MLVNTKKLVISTIKLCVKLWFAGQNTQQASNLYVLFDGPQNCEICEFENEKMCQWVRCCKLVQWSISSWAWLHNRHFFLQTFSAVFPPNIIHFQQICPFNVLETEKDTEDANRDRQRGTRQRYRINRQTDKQPKWEGRDTYSQSTYRVITRKIKCFLYFNYL